MVVTTHRRPTLPTGPSIEARSDQYPEAPLVATTTRRTVMDVVFPRREVHHQCPAPLERVEAAMETEEIFPTLNFDVSKKFS